MADKVSDATNNGNNGQIARSSETKVSFSFSKVRMKTHNTKGSLLSPSGFQEDRGSKQIEAEQRLTPLVIPLAKNQKKTLIERKREERKNTEDDAAAEALSQSAAHHFALMREDSSATSTNFSGKGNLVITSGENSNYVGSFTASDSDKECQQFQKDVEELPNEVPVDSEAYNKVPIHEFGAAMLRGMGWNGGDGKSGNSPSTPAMRPHRLGLGATPKLVLSNTSGKPRRPDQVKRDERLAQQQAEFEAQRRKRVAQDKQQTLQMGSIVWCQGQRAKLLQLTGVPGLNRVRVQFERDPRPTAVRKGEISLVARSDLERQPFREADPEQMQDVLERQEATRTSLGKSSESQHSQPSGDRDGHERERKRRKRDENRLSDGRDSHRRSHDDRKTSRNSRHKTSTKGCIGRNARDASDQNRSWLIPNIRVRVVTNKLGSRYFKQKGVVVDVTHGPCATLKMSEGQLLDRVPERYLETALPKAGGNVIVLAGEGKHSKGKLLERNSGAGVGVVQVYEDMSVLTLSLDDIAEWFGPLDDDLMY